MSAPFYIVNAFTTEPFGGNPAAVVFLDDLQDAVTMQGIAANFNQPMVAFLRRSQTSSSDAASEAHFDVRWFTPTSEVALCGHATLASSGLLFSTPALLPTTVTAIHFHATSGVVLTAKKVGDYVQISLPATLVEAPPPEEEERFKGIVSTALGGANVTFVGLGGKGFEPYLLAEIEQSDDLANRPLNLNALLDAAPRTRIVTVTSRSADPNIAFISRMFAPAAGVLEDPVCGSAHCLLTPYWTQKLGRNGEELLARQVSARGGLLQVKFLEQEGLVTLAGPTRTTTKGDVLL